MINYDKCFSSATELSIFWNKNDFVNSGWCQLTSFARNCQACS